MPGPRRHQITRHHDFLVYVLRAADLGVEPALGDSRNRTTANHVRSGHDLDAVTNAGYRHALGEKVADDAEKVAVVTQVLRRPATRHHEPDVFFGPDVAEGDVGREPVAW